MSTLTEQLTLANGVTIPRLGFGTWQIPDGSDAYDAVSAALKAGYRHIDTARSYGNEASVGRAIRDSGIPRDQIFVTTKLPAEIKNSQEVRHSFEDSSKALDIDPVDLYLIHAPWPWDDKGHDHMRANIAIWHEMEGLLEAGRVRAIGVANFHLSHLASLMEASRVRPQVNQVPQFVGYTLPEVNRFCQEHNILVEGYSPLANGAILDHPMITDIAKKHAVTPAQVCIRYLLEKNLLPLPRSTSPTMITETTQVDFTLAAEDIARLDAVKDTDSNADFAV